MSQARSPEWGRDALCCAALAAGTALWLAFWPRDLNWADEGLYLYEAKRILAGDVLYRDLFEIVTPGAWYAMAAMFGVFGASLAAARGLMAVVHVGAVLALYLACRARGVRRPLAVAAALAYPALSYPGMPYATPHWFSTLLNLLLLLVWVRAGTRELRRTALLSGAVCGAMAMVQQQRAAPMIVGALLVLLLAPLGGDRAPGARGRVMRCVHFLIGLGLVALPIMTVAVAMAGPAAVLDGLIAFPLGNYRRFHEAIPWAAYAGGVDVRPFILTWLPVVLVVPALRLIVPALRYRGGAEASAMLAELGLGLFAALSIAYHPNLKHLAVIAPIFFVIAADALEQALRSLGDGAAATWGGRLIAAVLCAALGAELVRIQRLRHAAYPVRADTAFGTVDFPGGDELLVTAAVADGLAGAAAPEVVCAPHCAGLYLTTGARNPTRYQILNPGYSGPEHIAEALRVLDSERPRYVVIEPIWVSWRTDPIVAYVRQHYRRVRLGNPPALKYALFERRPD